MKVFTGCIAILIGLALGVYVGIYVMLYGGIMAALNNWGVDNGAVVCGILRAIFFEWGIVAGVIVGVLAAAIGGAISGDNI